MALKVNTFMSQNRSSRRGEALKMFNFIPEWSFKIPCSLYFCPLPSLSFLSIQVGFSSSRVTSTPKNILPVCFRTGKTFFTCLPLICPLVPFTGLSHKFVPKITIDKGKNDCIYYAILEARCTNPCIDGVPWLGRWLRPIGGLACWG